MSEHIKQKDLRKLGPVDTHTPVGSRREEAFTVQVPGTTTIFSNQPCADPLTSGAASGRSKNAQQTLLGLEPVAGDPNSTDMHADVIRTTLLSKMKDETIPLEDRQSAERLFKQLYPPASDRTTLTDLERRGVGYEVKTVKVSG